MQFEWNEEKRDANLAKHGIDFLAAAAVFDGRARVEWESPRGTEVRFAITAELQGRIVTVIWTWRDEDTVRIVSARRARHGEERVYRQLHR